MNFEDAHSSFQPFYNTSKQFSGALFLLLTKRRGRVNVTRSEGSSVLRLAAGPDGGCCSVVTCRPPGTVCWAV